MSSPGAGLALVSPADTADAMADLPPTIAIHGLTMRFGASKAESVLAVDNVSLSLAPGEFVSLVGPSGCGKTTILNLLTGLLKEEPEGEVRVLGKRPYAGNPDIAYMLARDSLLPWRTALDNAAFGMEVRGVPKSERMSRVNRAGIAGGSPS